jgi:hypothetical protein
MLEKRDSNFNTCPNVAPFSLQLMPFITAWPTRCKNRVGHSIITIKNQQKLPWRVRDCCGVRAGPTPFCNHKVLYDATKCRSNCPKRRPTVMTTHSRRFKPTHPRVTRTRPRSVKAGKPSSNRCERKESSKARSDLRSLRLHAVTTRSCSLCALH